MSRHHDVHVSTTPGRPHWKVTQRGQVLSIHRTHWAAVRAARRDRVELVTHGRNGRFRTKDRYGREGAGKDTEY